MPELYGYRYQYVLKGAKNVLFIYYENLSYICIMNKSILITGGAGFIGSHCVRHFVKKYPDYKIINFDALTYAGNIASLSDIDSASNYSFIKGDIRDADLITSIYEEHKIDTVLHFAAESHVDRSIENPLAFVETNVMGTCTMLNVAKAKWKDEFAGKTFFHISTDEVYGSLGETGYFVEDTSYDPRSPYSASKASSDHFVRAYHHTYGLPVLITNCSNNYGPYQFPEKLIPLMINNIIQEKSLPVYGDGLNVRDWLMVTDHVEAIDTVLHGGKIGETYNIGGHNERTNLALVHALCDIIDKKLGREEGHSRNLISFVTDRPGHDRRYAIDAEKIKNELGWEPRYTVEQGLEETIDWYLNNKEWLHNITSGEYQKYYDKQYKARV